MDKNKQYDEKYQELLLISSDQRQKQDLSAKFVLIIHALNLSNDLICIGLLEDDPEDEYLLPENWNSPQAGVYSFKYKLKNEIIIQKFINNKNFFNINCV